MHLTRLPTHSCWLKRAEKSTARLHMYTRRSNSPNMAAERCLTASDKRPFLKEEKLASCADEAKHDETDHTKPFHNEMIKEMFQEQVTGELEISSRGQILQGTVEQILDVPVLERAQQLVELPEVSQDRIQQRTVEQLEAVEKIDENPEIQMV